MTRLLAAIRQFHPWCVVMIAVLGVVALFLAFRKAPTSAVYVPLREPSSLLMPPDPAPIDVIRLGDLECGRLTWSPDAADTGRAAQFKNAGFRTDAASDGEYVSVMTCKYLIGFPGFHLQLLARREPTAGRRREWVVASAKRKDGSWSRQAFTSDTIASDSLECEIVGARLGSGPSEELPVSGLVDVRCEAALGGAALSASREEFYVIDLMKRSATRLYACEGSGRVVEWPGGEGATILLPEKTCVSDFVVAY